MSKTPVSDAALGYPCAVITNTYIRLRSTQHADLTVYHARTSDARLGMVWGGLLLNFHNAQAAQGVREAVAAARTTLVHLPADLGTPAPSDDDAYDRPTIAIDWTQRPSYAVMTRSAVAPDQRRTIRWTDIYLGPVTLQILDRAAWHSSMELLKLAHQTATAVFLDGHRHRADPTRDTYRFKAESPTGRRKSTPSPRSE